MAEHFETHTHIDALKKVTTPFDFSLEDIQVVDSIPRWCEENGLEEDNPMRTAKVVRNRSTGKYLILLAAQVTSAMVNHVKTQMAREGLEVAADRLYDADAFLTHRILHELYHAIHDMLGKQLTATECDRWAFQQMGILSSDYPSD